jgi:hypothetical protein
VRKLLAPGIRSATNSPLGGVPVHRLDEAALAVSLAVATTAPAPEEDSVILSPLASRWQPVSIMEAKTKPGKNRVDKLLIDSSLAKMHWVVVIYVESYDDGVDTLAYPRTKTDLLRPIPESR